MVLRHLEKSPIIPTQRRFFALTLVTVLTLRGGSFVDLRLIRPGQVCIDLRLVKQLTAHLAVLGALRDSAPASRARFAQTSHLRHCRGFGLECRRRGDQCACGPFVLLNVLVPVRYRHGSMDIAEKDNHNRKRLERREKKHNNCHKIQHSYGRFPGVDYASSWQQIADQSNTNRFPILLRSSWSRTGGHSDRRMLLHLSHVGCIRME
jgi:hypothetical protein